MKYKHIPSFLHNFTDSFMSLVNYSNGEYAVDGLLAFLRESGSGVMVVRWLPSLEVARDDLPKDIRETLERYAQWLPVLAVSMRVDVSRIADMTTIFSLEGERVKADTTGVDDRGRFCKAPVKFWG